MSIHRLLPWTCLLWLLLFSLLACSPPKPSRPVAHPSGDRPAAVAFAVEPVAWDPPTRLPAPIRRLAPRCWGDAPEVDGRILDLWGACWLRTDHQLRCDPTEGAQTLATIPFVDEEGTSVARPTRIDALGPGLGVMPSLIVGGRAFGWGEQLRGVARLLDSEGLAARTEAGRLHGVASGLWWSQQHWVRW